MHRFWFAILAFTVVSVMHVQAQELSLSKLGESIREAHRDGNATYLVEIDNDSLLLQDRDGFYSSGARLSLLYRARSGSRLLVNDWRIGQEIYTPSNINLSRPRAGSPERPYAGWLYGGFAHRVYRADGSRHSIGIDLGCLGPCAGGEWTQKQLHRLIDQPQPKGWSRQIRNEAGIVLHGDIGTPRWHARKWLDASAHLHGRFGNIFTDIGAMATARAGRLNRLPDEPTLHTFVSMDARIVAYDATLQGGYFSNGAPYTVSPRRDVFEGEAGVAWIRPPFSASFSVVRRTNEVRGLSASAGAQNFARLQFSYTPR